MTRQQLHARIDDILNAAEREKMFGTVEFEVRSGKITLLRTVKTEKIEDEGNNSHATKPQR
ncbi:MAG: hypothetical protein WA674_04880 [Candidatus Acidiferrales bacterium]